MVRLFPVRRFAACVLLLSILLPAAGQAAPVGDILRTRDDSAVNRGEFIRAAVLILGLPMPDERRPLPFKRPVPERLRLAVSAAMKRKALTIFGNDLLLSRSITRGEALFVLMRLQGLKPASTPVHFPDIPNNSDLEQAVQVGTEKHWMAPLRENFFGAGSVLTGREGRVLLRKAVGQDSPMDVLGPDGKIPSIIIRFKSKEKPPLPQQDMLQAVWQLLQEQFLYKDKLKDDEAAYRAAEALVQGIDPYTTFMRPLPAKEFQSRLDGEVSGIGAQVEYKDNVLTVISPLRGSPAEKAGLLPGDQIIAVDGQSIAGLDFLSAVSKVRGPKGSTAMFRVRRQGGEVEITVIRDIIRVPEIEISYQTNVAVVKLLQFGERTRAELRSLMLDVQNRNPRGVVLDLRSNPGGLLDAASIVLSNFLPQGSPVASIKYRDETVIETTADPPTIDRAVPLVVLVNKGSASASEIVAGALQDAKRATIVGQKTFGKGSVQELVEFKNGATMKLTIAEWETPSGRKINGVGVSPDVLVEESDGRDELMLKAMDIIHR